MDLNRYTDRPQLTPRERQVLTMLSEGHSMRDIAGDLGISVKTVETHRRGFTTKLGIRSVAQPCSTLQAMEGTHGQ